MAKFAQPCCSNGEGVPARTWPWHPATFLLRRAINFWKTVKRPSSRRRLIELVELTPYSRAVFKECIGVLEDGGGDSLLRAWAVAIAQDQSRNGLGVDWSYAKRVSNMNASSWAKLPARIELAGRRLRHVRIECLPYEETLQRCNTKTVLFLDPPYMPSTRVSAEVYLHEFDRKMHQGLLDTVRRLRKPKVILCGYRNKMMDDTLDGGRRTDIKTKSFAAPRAKGCKLDERVLSVWTSFCAKTSPTIECGVPQLDNLHPWSLESHRGR